jgi:uncharacterized protein YjbJ (UPF0337 family)
LDIIITGGTPMNEDRIIGTAKNAGGKLEEGAGRLTGDVKSQVQGKAQQVAGDVQEMYGQVKDKAADAAQAVREGAVEAEDYLRHTIESRPYTTAAIALAVGFMIGRMGRREHW